MKNWIFSLILVCTGFITNAQITELPNGNVGVGVTSPSSKLHVNGDLKMNIGEGFKLFGDTQYFGQNLDAIIFEMQDGNSSNGATDGGFVFRGYTPTDQVAKEWMTIKSGGKIGIGTSVPTSKLHVNGDLKMNIGEGFKVFGDTQYFGQNLDAIIFEMQDGNSSNGATDGGFVFRGYTPTDKVAKEWMTIKSGGKVGIGTSVPTSKLHVNGDLKMNIGEGFKVFGDTQYFGQNLDAIIFEMQDGNSSNGATDGGFVFRGYTPTDKVAKEWMTIKSGGKVGIGTSNTGSHKLAVEGSIGAREIIVQTGTWSDFVFNDDYALPSLEEVENHIKEKGHLANIPSEKEAIQNGVNLGVMDAKLLQKIEELTLYIIEINKRVIELEKENSQLKNQN